VVGQVIYVQVQPGGVTDEPLAMLRTSDGKLLGDVAGPHNSQAAQGPQSTSYVDLVKMQGTLYLGITQVTQGTLTNTMTFSLQTLDGRTLWRMPVAAPTTVVAQDEGLLFLASGALVAVRVADGTVLWRQAVPSEVLTAADGHLFMSQSGEYFRCYPNQNRSTDLRALDETTGRLLWVLGQSATDGQVAAGGPHG
jgi:hypothetical protein